MHINHKEGVWVSPEAIACRKRIACGPHACLYGTVLEWTMHGK